MFTHHRLVGRQLVEEFAVHEDVPVHIELLVAQFGTPEIVLESALRSVTMFDRS